MAIEGRFPFEVYVPEWPAYTQSWCVADVVDLGRAVGTRALMDAALAEEVKLWHDTQTLAIAIRTWEALRLQAGAKAAAWSHIVAVSVMMALPSMHVFFIAQRYFIQGVVMSGIKG